MRPGHSRSILKIATLSLFLATGILAATPSYAYFTCSGKLTRLSLAPDGRLMISFGVGSWWVCNLSSAQNNVAPETCRAWYAGFLSTQKADHSIKLYFDPSNTSNADNGPECSALGNWVWVSPYHVDLKTD